MMLKSILVGTAVATAFAAPALADNPELTIVDFVGTINIEPGDKITIKGERSGTVDRSGEHVTIDGGETINSVNCRNSYGKFNISINKKRWIGSMGGFKDLDEYPVLFITAPETLHLTIKKSVIFGETGNLGSADLDLSSCGELTIGDVAGTLDLDINGSADLIGGSAGSVNIDIGGSGDVTLEDVGAADIDVSGSGDVELADVNGPLTVQSSGSGDFVADTINGDLAYDGRGSSDFEAGSVTGRISIDVSGSGDVMIDDGEASLLMVSASGSSNVEFDGTAEEAELYASGASDIYVSKVTGETRSRKSGSASIDVDN